MVQSFDETCIKSLKDFLPMIVLLELITDIYVITRTFSLPMEDLTHRKLWLRFDLTVILINTFSLQFKTIKIQIYF